MTLPQQTAQPSPQVLSVGAKDRKRLLEFYVKRSLSLNDGTRAMHRQRRKQSKWVTLGPQGKRERTHSSDSSLHLGSYDSDEDPGQRSEVFSESETTKKPQATRDQPESKSRPSKKNSRNDRSSASFRSDAKPLKWFAHFDKDKQDVKQQGKASKAEQDGGANETLPLPLAHDHISVEAKKSKEGKKKKSSIWKSVLGWFSKGSSDKQEEQDGGDSRHEEALKPPEPSTPPVSCLPLSDVFHSGEVNSRKKRKHLKTLLKKSSGDSGLEKATRNPLSLDMSAVDNKPMAKSIEEVEPTNFYYEKVSEELDKIVYEVKKSPLEENKTFCDPVQPTNSVGIPMSQEEVIERIIALIKQQGDVIDSKLHENPAICSYFNTLSYGSFKQLADQYVQLGVPEQKSQPPVVAPELVKFAFTLDFTARVAGLSRHTPGHILGFGNMYLKDRFTNMTEGHLHNSDIKEENIEPKESTNKEDKEHLSEEN